MLLALRKPAVHHFIVTVSLQMESQYLLVSVKPEQLHMPAREDHMAVGPPTSKIDQKIDPAFFIKTVALPLASSAGHRLKRTAAVRVVPTA